MSLKDGPKKKKTFSYQTPFRREVTGNATLFPRPSKKGLETNEAPNIEGQGCEKRIWIGANNKKLFSCITVGQKRSIISLNRTISLKG